MKMKNWMRSAGFTLVELIVVIAVLGILGAGAAVGYSGYVKKANKAADEALVAQVKYALEVAYVADPSYSGATAVVLSKDAAATVSPDSGAATDWVNKAMTDAFGANWANELKLQYDGWANGVAASQEMLRIFGDINADSPMYSVVNGTADITFADKIDELFDKVGDVSKYVAGKVVNNNLGLDINNGAELINAAAKATEGNQWIAHVDFNEKNAEAFIAAWAYGYPFAVNVSNNKITDAMDLAMASAAATRARNECMANFVSGQFPEFYSAIAEYSATVGTGEITDKIPQDVVSDFDNAKVRFASVVRDGTMSDDEWNTRLEALATALEQYLYSGQAEADAAAYYTMMHTVANTDTSTIKLDDDTYWDRMGEAVGLYGAIARGETSMNELSTALNNTAAGAVAILAIGSGTEFDVRSLPEFES